MWVSAVAICIVFALNQAGNVSTLTTKNGKVCKPKFAYGNHEFEGECTVADLPDEPWCYVTSGGWDYCEIPAVKQIDTEGGEKCAMPFVYKLVQYYDQCTTKGHGRPWCYTASGWDNCREQKEVVAPPKRIVAPPVKTLQIQPKFVPIARKPCDDEPCRNGGTCANTNSGYKCKCKTGFSGSQCQTKTETNYCDRKPCRNGGTCYNLVNSRTFKCKCQTGFTGGQCQNKIKTSGKSQRKKPCDKKPCKNGGTCSNLSSRRYKCKCKTGFRGSRCQFKNKSMSRSISRYQTKKKPCDKKPCKNGGTCSNLSSRRYKCKCKTGFRGSRCQFKRKK
ncbi:uncharacterized protein LOC141911596 [Tubulanus polymorphus]|uniref:uncharacterized protein LOC141911596 n=1 Tax=Tubulanus polymorphus TaxID=672921 RepID=UPI003DA5DBEF